MQVAQIIRHNAANRRQRFVIVLALIMLAALLVSVWSGNASLDAQETPQYRFFGFAGDVTVDGAPIEPGVLITAKVGGAEVARAEVNAAGAWVLDIDSTDFEEASCNLVFEVDGLRGVHPGDDCSRRVRLALKSDTVRANGEAPAEMAELSDAALNDARDQSRSLVRPASPRTGSGGLAESRPSASPAWPRVAAITAILVLVTTLAALLLSRRSDHAV